MRYAYGQAPIVAAGQVPFAVAAARDPLNAQKFKTQRQNQPEDYWQPLS
jgi:hypothetical protein